MGKKRIIQKGAEAGAPEAKAARIRSGKKVSEGRVYVYSSYNNTLMSLSDRRGNVLAQVSAGSIGFKGTKKATPFAASRVAETLSHIARERGMEKIDVFMKGVGSGRDSALRTLAAKGFEISSIRDVTPIPHNGPRPRKARRV